MAILAGAADFLEKGKAWIKQAVEADESERYADAATAYENGVGCLLLAAKYEKSEPARKVICAKTQEYLARAEQLKLAVSSGKSNPLPKGAPAKGTKESGGSNGEDAPATIDALTDSERPNVAWEDVAGLEEAKMELQQAVIFPTCFAYLYENSGRSPSKGSLLYGPPGTGKTHLARALATACKSAFFSVQCSDVVSKWMGDSEKSVSALFKRAREAAPSIIFIDEIDALCSVRTSNESDATRRIKTEFLTQMQGLLDLSPSQAQKHVFVLAGTNLPWEIDPAMIRRLSKLIYIPLPDKPAREALISIHLRKIAHSLTPQDISSLADQTDGYSGSDITNACKDAMNAPLRRIQRATHFHPLFKKAEPKQHGDTSVKIDEDDTECVFFEPCEPQDEGAIKCSWTDMMDKRIKDVSITHADFVEALRRCKKTVSQSDIGKYCKFTKEYGMDGA